MNAINANDFKMVSMEVCQFEGWKKAHPNAYVLEVQYQIVPATYNLGGYRLTDQKDCVLIIGRWDEEKGEGS